MIAAALAIYAVTPISLPTGMTVDVASTSHYPVSDPPSDIALSQRGTLAILVYPKQGQSQILVVRPDGTQVFLRRPPDKILAKTFRVSAVVGPRGEATFPNARFAGVALTNDGTPFATVNSPFSGAYTGNEQGVFTWSGSRWRDALSNTNLPADTRNFIIGAVQSTSSFVCNGNYSAAIANLDASDSDPHFRENPAILVDGRRGIALGYGAATAMRGRFVVGYTAGQRMVPSPEPTHSVAALEWIDRRRKSLGRGVAYGVNSSGDVVGSNDGELDEIGKPTLWRRGRAIQLSNSSGSAYAIADDGTIVGGIGDVAFVVRGSDANSRLIPIDALVGDARWHITAAYAIAANGRILATGYYKYGPLRVLLLDPIGSRP